MLVTTPLTVVRVALPPISKRKVFVVVGGNVTDHVAAIVEAGIVRRIVLVHAGDIGVGHAVIRILDQRSASGAIRDGALSQTVDDVAADLAWVGE